MTLRRRFLAAAQAFRNPDRVVLPRVVERLERAEVEKQAWEGGEGRWERVETVAKVALQQAGLSSGRMLEIGGRLNPRHMNFPQFDYTALDLAEAPGAAGEKRVEVAVGNITDCPHIPDASFDFIFSLDVFEHIDRPWLAAKEIQRLLKPGGVTVHSTLFSWRYHPCPIDYWRYSAEGLKSLFGGLECLHADFDYTERRRDLRGRDGNMIECDALGGWRENVRVHYAGTKPRVQQ
ncbi:Methyltransferase domain protein [Tritonibacter multivorans]|uniref:Methyltransferase domain protein n=1 Tax=Tritonibacter multivorans TaxID=928856 RepID=A0A0N7M0L6_9RHOB|nr:class I SAM-dependent methyltransferase [Tritonibacter multivorans]MDA7422712.1 class I SAM-dependent methyltransferase [Tritonibacter multivorans]CUH80809.1 Methyltransferase domain protein [Tritonibacter multivorans]SFD55827.1 Methyltransferase domain-containing protein [Tritonibacter multivorans]